MKKLFCVLLTAVVCLCAVSFAGCEEDTTQKQLEEVQAQLQQITEKLNSLQEDNKAANDKLSILQQENNTINDKLSELEFENTKGTFFTLQEAYDNGLLKKTDLKDCCYYRFGEVWEGEDFNSEEWTKVEYTPTQSLSNLDKKIETKIKEVYYKLNEDRFYSKNEGYIGGIDDLTVRFFGKFNNTYVVLIDCSLWDYGASVIPTIVAGVAWWESGEGFKVFRTE